MRFLDEEGVTYNVEKGGEVPSDVKPGDTVNVSEGIMNRLEVMAMESSSLEEFLGEVYEEYPQHEGKAEIKEFLTKFYLDLGGPIDEGKSKISEGVMNRLEVLAMEASSLEEFLGDVYEEYPNIIFKPGHEGNAEIKEYLTKFYLDLGGPIDEGKLKKALTGLALFTALIAGNNAINNSFPEMKALKTAYEKAEKAGDEEKMKELKDKITKHTIYLDTGKGGPQTVKEIVKKCYQRGMTKENITKVVKEYQNRLTPPTTSMQEDLLGGLAKGINKFISGDEIDFTSLLKGLSDLKPKDSDDEKIIDDVNQSIMDGEVPFKVNSKEEEEFFEALTNANAKEEDIEEIKNTIEALRKVKDEKIKEIKEIVKKCLKKGMVKENINKVVKEYRKRLNEGNPKR